MRLLPSLEISTSVKYMYICVTVIGQMTHATVMILIIFNRQTYAKSVNSDQTAPREAVL